MRVIMNLNFQAQFFNFCCFYAYSKLRFLGAKIQIHNFEFFSKLNFLTQFVIFNSVGRLWGFRTLRCNDIDARIVNSKTPPCFNFQPFEEHEINKVGSVVSGAVITSNGKLTPGFEYIQTLREENESTMTCPGDFNSEKKVNGICIVAIWRIFSILI